MLPVDDQTTALLTKPLYRALTSRVGPYIAHVRNCLKKTGGCEAADPEARHARREQGYTAGTQPFLRCAAAPALPPPGHRAFSPPAPGASHTGGQRGRLYGRKDQAAPRGRPPRWRWPTPGR